MMAQGKLAVISMSFFELVTPLTYWVLIGFWGYVLYFVYRQKDIFGKAHRAISTLLLVLAVDAFRSLFESIYFGGWYTARVGLLPNGVYEFLVRPEMVIIPKIANLAAAILILFLLLKRLIPSIADEHQRHHHQIEQLNTEVVERKKIELELKTSEGNLNEAQRIAKLGSWYLDTATNEVIWSNELYKMYGFDPAFPPPPYTEHQKLFTPESWKLLSKSLSNTVEKGVPYELELETVKKDGNNGWIWVRGETVANACGNRIGLRGVAQDITDRKQVETALHDSKQQLNLILSTVPDLIWLKDTKGFYLACNPLFERFFGAKEAKIIGKTDYDFVDTEIANSFRQHDKAAMEADQPTVNEEWLIFADDGHQALMETTKTPLKADDGTVLGVLGVAHDITERKKSMDVLEENQMALKYEVDVKNRFFSIIAHDLKSPFTSLLGMTQMMSQMAGSFSKEKLVEYATLVNESGDRVFELLQNLLEWSRLQMEGGKFEQQIISLHDLSQESINMLYPVAVEKNITLTNAINNDAAYADPDMVQTVIRNLISNALKFTPSDGEVEISSAKKDGFIQVTVSDTGVGISKEQAANVFALDQKTSTVGTAGEKGTGLGLPLCKEMIEKNDGMIWVESTTDEGSRFHFTLPIEPGDE